MGDQIPSDSTYSRAKIEKYKLGVRNRLDGIKNGSREPLGGNFYDDAKLTEDQQKFFGNVIKQSILSEELLTPEKLQERGFRRIVKSDDKFNDVYPFCEKYINDLGETVTIHHFNDTTMISYQNKEKDADFSDTRVYDGKGNFIRGQMLVPDEHDIKYYHSYKYEVDENGNLSATEYEHNHVKYIL